MSYIAMPLFILCFWGAIIIIGLKLKKRRHE